MSATVNGLGNLKAALTRFARERAPKVAAAAAAAATRRFAKGARRRAPRESGELAASIEERPVKLRGARALGAVAVESDHAAAQEFGTHDTPANPFLRPTGHEDARDILTDAAAAAGRALES